MFISGGNKEDLTINYGILGGQFHFERMDTLRQSKYGCYGQPERETTYYMAGGKTGYQTLTRDQFEGIAHLFPRSCGIQDVPKQRKQSERLRLLADNQRMAKSIQSKLVAGKGNKDMQPTMVLLVPFCPNNDNEALNFLHQWRQHAKPVNVAGYLFGPPDDQHNGHQQ